MVVVVKRGRVNRGLGDSTDSRYGFSRTILEPIVVPEDADERLELEGLRLHVQTLELPHLMNLCMVVGYIKIAALLARNPVPRDVLGPSLSILT